MPHANSTTSSPRCTSPRASESTFPCSSEITPATRSAWALTSSRKRNSTLVRALVEDSDQDVKAFRAACTARSTSAASASRSSCCGRPVAGFQTIEVRVETPLVRPPPIQWSMVVMAKSVLLGDAVPNQHGAV